MGRKFIKLIFSSIGALFIFASFTFPVSAQNSNDDLSPKTQQYINNLNEVQQAENDGKPVTQADNNPSSGLPGFWTIVFYGFLTGVSYALWRWVKSLKNRN